VPATLDPTAADNNDQASSTADRLLAGAADLFRRKGYAATTTRELSALLGIQNASLYYHMEKKEDLLYKLCVSTLEEVADVLRGCLAETSDPIEQLKLIVLRYTTVALQERDRHATMLIEIRALSEERRASIVALRDKNVAVVRKTVAAAQKAGQLRSDIKPKFLTLTLFNLLNWSIFWYRPDGELTPEKIAAMMSTVFLDGVAAKSSSPGKKSIAGRPVRP
jgi:AcrR family transcriptional regulator